MTPLFERVRHAGAFTIANMKTSILICACSVAVAAAQAQPVADVDAGFAAWEYTGPVGSTNFESTEMHWLRESTGLWDGQQVQSWLLIWAPDSAVRVVGSVDFGQRIVDVLDSRAALLASSALRRSDLSYDFSHAAVGLEAADRGRTSFADGVLQLNWTASGPGDHVRVLTAVPEPAIWLMFAAGLVAVGWLRSRGQD